MLQSGLSGLRQSRKARGIGTWWTTLSMKPLDCVSMMSRTKKEKKAELARLSYVRAHALVAEAHEGIRCVTCLSDLICCATINIVMTGIVARFMFWAFSCVSVTGAAASRWRPL